MAHTCTPVAGPSWLQPSQIPGTTRDCAKEPIAWDCNSLGMSAALAASHVLFLPELRLQFLALPAASLCGFVSLSLPHIFFFSPVLIRSLYIPIPL